MACGLHGLDCYCKWLFTVQGFTPTQQYCFEEKALLCFCVTKVLSVRGDCSVVDDASMLAIAGPLGREAGLGVLLRYPGHQAAVFRRCCLRPACETSRTGSRRQRLETEAHSSMLIIQFLGNSLPRRSAPLSCALCRPVASMQRRSFQQGWAAGGSHCSQMRRILSESACRQHLRALAVA